MSLYLALFRCRLNALFQYRGAAIAGFFTQLFWGMLKMMVLIAFFKQAGTAIQPMGLSQAIVFTWLGQALLPLLPWKIDREVEGLIRSGNVAYELVRPVDLYWTWFARSSAMNIVPTLLRAPPLFIIAGLFLGLTAPVSWAGGVAFGTSLVFASMLSAAINTCVLITIFWTLSADGIMRLLPETVVLLSGLIVPLPLFPDWMQPFLSLQPFRGIIDIPCRLYTGMIPANEALYYLAFQLGWTLILIALGRYLLKRALKSVVIQGG